MFSRTRLHHHNLNIFKVEYVTADDSITFPFITCTSAIRVLPQEATRFSVLNHIPIAILEADAKAARSKAPGWFYNQFKMYIKPLYVGTSYF